MSAKPLRLQLLNAALLVVDIQERLLPAIFERERVVANALRLIHGARVLGVPIFVTEQYRHGLGATVAAIAEAVPGFAPVEKLAFSAAGAAGLWEALGDQGRSDLIVCGIEAHVCVCQTVLDLIESGFRPFVAADAVSSRTTENWQAGLERMRQAGTTMGTTEMVLFELLERAGTPEFKEILKLVR